MLSPASLNICKILPICARTGNQAIRKYSVSKMSEPQWKIEKARLTKMNWADRRKDYKIKDYLTVDSVDPWCNYVVRNKGIEAKKHTLDDLTEFKKISMESGLNKDLGQKVSIFKGDITKLEVDAIVNAANSALKAGGGVDGAIHRAAGPLLQAECDTLGGCPTGDAKATCAYNLPARYVIHTVGPQDGSPTKLESCYEKCLALTKENNFRSIAFPCISTGIYGFPNRLAAHIALRTARKFLETNDHIERIIFCTFMPIDVDIYETLLQMYFPLHDWNYNDGNTLTE
ncbi:macro domain-containing protein RSc0334-like [Anticarsia gemmatalis]|uniref:macro domain-containing protein RSc0334-like n=1 Tax=Anticarsia gemmatalis TaxID=129554 RepID=UPI003F7730ED